ISLLDPLHSAVASSTSALLLLIGSFMLHIPLSSSLTTVAAITGAGTAQNSGAVRWIQVLRLMAYFIGTVLVCAAAAFIIIGLGAGAVVNIRWPAMICLHSSQHKFSLLTLGSAR